jgi:Ca2+-binding RTX toxin-like protein
VKSADADILIVDEDSGNDYGERKYALVLNEDTLAIEPDGTGYFIAQAGGNKNPRALAGVSTYGGTFESKSGSEFSGSWNVTALVATKADESFFTKEELAGNGVQTVEQSRPLSEHVFIGAVQQGGESGGALKATKADYGGQLFMFSLDLPGIELKPVVGTPGADTLMRPDASMDLTMIGNTIFTGAGDDDVDVALSDGFKNSIFTGSGVDTIYAGTRDVITGGSGDDEIWAIKGDGSRLSGGLGNDTIYIETSGNRALGGAGNDKFYVFEATGTNYLNGGAGNDQFWLINGPGDRPAAKQFVMDFKVGEDKVGLQDVMFSSLSFTQVGGDTLLKVAGVEVGHFANLSATSLNSQNNFAGLA